MPQSAVSVAVLVLKAWPSAAQQLHLSPHCNRCLAVLEEIAEKPKTDQSCKTKQWCLLLLTSGGRQISSCKQPVVFVVCVVRRKTDLVLQTACGVCCFGRPEEDRSRPAKKNNLWCLLFPMSGGRNISSCKQLVVFVVSVVRRKTDLVPQKKKNCGVCCFRRPEEDRFRPANSLWCLLLPSSGGRQLSSCKGPVVFVASVVRIKRGQTRTSGTCSGCSLGREKEAVLLMSAAFTLQQRSLPDVHEVSTVLGARRGMQMADLPVSKDAFC